VDDEGELLTVKVDYANSTDIKLSTDPQQYVDDIESLFPDAGDVVAYTIYGGQDYTHLLQGDDGTWSVVDADFLTALLGPEATPEEHKQPMAEVDWNDLDHSGLTFTTLFGGEGLFGDGDERGGGDGGLGPASDPDLDSLVGNGGEDDV